MPVPYSGMISLIGRAVVLARRSRPGRLLLIGYLSYAVVGWLLLCLPFSQQGAGLSPLDALFIACSAVSTTGLATAGVPESLSFIGELVLLLLIQAGGIGYMTFGSFVLLAGSGKLSGWREGVFRTSFTLPEGFAPARFLRQVVIFTAVLEAMGACALYFAFTSGAAPSALSAQSYDSFSGNAQLIWHSVFHSVSAFCTAGFSLFPNSLESFRGSVGVNATISLLSLSGAMGFILLVDAARVAVGRRGRMTLTSRIIIRMTALFLLVGTALLFIADGYLSDLPAEERLLASWFQCMTATTTVGFNTVPIGALAVPSVLLLYIVMIVGASPSGTGGGLKSTAVSALLATVGSTLRGEDRITFRGVEVPGYRLQAAFAALGFYVVTLAFGGYLLLLTESRELAAAQHSFENLLFEAASALGTVGISRGVTSDLTELGKLVVIALMLVGRLGPLTFGLALFGKNEDAANSGDPPLREDVAV